MKMINILGKLQVELLDQAFMAPVAMGYVENSFSKIDTKVFLEVRGKKYPAIYVDYHFIKKVM